MALVNRSGHGLSGRATVDKEATYAATTESENEGGWRTVETIQDRDKLASWYKKEGMAVWVKEENKLYQLISDQWVERPGFLGEGTSSSVTEEPTSTRPEKFVVICVAGQSNAVGYDESPLTKADVSADTNRIFELVGNSKETATLEPLGHCAHNMQDMRTAATLNNTQEGGLSGRRDGTKGIHLPLCNLLLNYIPQDYGIIMIPVAYGATKVVASNNGNANTFWATNSQSWGPNSNYSYIVQNRIKHCLDLNENNIFAGIVWCQGEHNISDLTSLQNGFPAMVTQINNSLQSYKNRTVKNKIDESMWFIYESTPWYMNAQGGRNIWNFYKEWLKSKTMYSYTGMYTSEVKTCEGNYVELPDWTPMNPYNAGTSSQPPAHFGQNAFRTVIAPRVARAMLNAGVIPVNSYDADTISTTSSESPSVDTETLKNEIKQELIQEGIGSGGSGSVSVDTNAIKQEVKQELQSQFVTTEQASEFATKAENATTIADLRSYFDLYEARIAQLEKAVREGTTDIEEIIRKVTVTEEMLVGYGDWSVVDGNLSYNGELGSKTYAQIIQSEYNAMEYHNNVQSNSTYGIVVAQNTENNKYVWIYADNSGNKNKVFWTEKESSTSFTEVQASTQTAQGNRELLKVGDADLTVWREGAIIKGTNGSQEFSVDVTAAVEAIGKTVETVEWCWGFSLGWSRTLNKVNSEQGYWTNIKLYNKE